MENWTNAKLCDVANLILGAVCFQSNAYIAGTPLWPSLRQLSSGFCPRTRRG